MKDFLIRCDTHGELAMVAAPELRVAMCYKCEMTCDVIDCGAHDLANYPTEVAE